MKVTNIIHLESIKENLSNRMTRRQVKALNAAIRKQIPTIPIYETMDSIFLFDMWRCPNCDTRYSVDFDTYEFCPKCGQAIDLKGGKG